MSRPRWTAVSYLCASNMLHALEVSLYVRRLFWVLLCVLLVVSPAVRSDFALVYGLASLEVLLLLPAQFVLASWLSLSVPDYMYGYLVGLCASNEEMRHELYGILEDEEKLSRQVLGELVLRYGYI